MTATIPLIELSALTEGRGRRVCTGGLDLALFRIGDAVYAIEDSCPHNGASLSNGKLQGKSVTCPAHGMRFNLEPDRDGGPARLQARKHTVCTVDGMVMLGTGEQPQTNDPNPVTSQTLSIVRPPQARRVARLPHDCLEPA